MKYCVCAILAVALLTSATSTKAEEDLCKVVGEAARAVMTARQRDTDLSAMMETADKQAGPFKDAARQLIIAAYERPAYSTEEIQAKVTAEFVNEILLACYKRVK
ncbi:hypothetical protein ACCS51_28760 [Rhizobium ruizarguesonis]